MYAGGDLQLEVLVVQTVGAPPYDTDLVVQSLDESGGDPAAVGQKYAPIECDRPTRTANNDTTGNQECSVDPFFKGLRGIYIRLPVVDFLK
jgi:hypothetical protein